MNKLPDESYTPCDYKYFLKVPDNYHLEYDAHYYSVLYTQLGKPAILKATMTEIRICDEYNRLICKHPRSYRDFSLYVTEDSHMPQEHRYYKEINLHDGAYYRRWATVYGDSMITLIDTANMKSRPLTAVLAYSIPARMFHTGWFRKPLTNVLKRMPASTPILKRFSEWCRIPTLPVTPPLPENFLPTLTSVERRVTNEYNN